jgi:hypothetical protein
MWSFSSVQANGTHNVGDRFTSGGKPVSLRVQLQSAPWVDISQVVVFGNGNQTESRVVPEVHTTDKGTFNFTLRPKVDTWYVVVVRGNRSLDPVVPKLSDRDVFPLAFSNPIWVDVDGDGKFTSIGRRSGSHRDWLREGRTMAPGLGLVIISLLVSLAAALRHPSKTVKRERMRSGRTRWSSSPV